MVGLLLFRAILPCVLGRGTWHINYPQRWHWTQCQVSTLDVCVKYVRFGKNNFPGKIAAFDQSYINTTCRCTCTVHTKQASTCTPIVRCIPMAFVHVQSFTLLVWTLYKGNKKEISELEDKFVKGDWSLPFSIPEPLRESSNVQVAPPAKRRRKGGNETKVGKENAGGKKQPAKPTKQPAKPKSSGMKFSISMCTN